VPGDAATASWPCSFSYLTSVDPMSPLPPMTTLFMTAPPVVGTGARRPAVVLASSRSRCNSLHQQEMSRAMVSLESLDELKASARERVPIAI
jgi:hypothetical protein